MGDIAIIASSSRSRSLIRDLRQTLDLDPSLTIFTSVEQGKTGLGLSSKNVLCTTLLFYCNIKSITKVSFDSWMFNMSCKKEMFNMLHFLHFY